MTMRSISMTRRNGEFFFTCSPLLVWNGHVSVYDNAPCASSPSQNRCEWYPREDALIVCQVGLREHVRDAGGPSSRWPHDVSRRLSPCGYRKQHLRNLQSAILGRPACTGKLEQAVSERFLDGAVLVAKRPREASGRAASVTTMAAALHPSRRSRPGLCSDPQRVDALVKALVATAYHEQTLVARKLNGHVLVEGLSRGREEDDVRSRTGRAYRLMASKMGGQHMSRRPHLRRSRHRSCDACRASNHAGHGHGNRVCRFCAHDRVWRST